MAGQSSCSANPVKGATFQITLPLHEVAVAEASAAALASPARGNETILLAEDDAVVRSLMSHVLSSHGYRVVAAVDGDDALQRFAEHANEIDLAVLDVVMPRKSGREVYDVIRAGRPGMRALFVSGYTADIIHKRGVADEGLEFIPKPMRPFDLLRRVRALLDTPSAAP